MKKIKLAVKPESSLEAILSLSPTVGALKALHPEAEIGILAEQCFTEAVSLVPGVSHWSPDTTMEAQDILFDLSNSSEESWGREDFEWKAYIQGCSGLNLTNPYHLIDLLKKASNSDSVDYNYELALPETDPARVPATLEPGESLRFAVCCASLSIDQLQATLDSLSRLSVPAVIHLTGNVAEKRKSSILCSAWQEKLNLVDLCGHLTLSEQAVVYARSDITIGGPGSSMLLSSGFGTFTLCVDETRNPLHYPYGHGHLVIQHTESEGFFAALSNILSDIVGFALSGNNGNIPSLDQWQSFADDRTDNYLGRVRLFATQKVETVLKDESFTELFLRPLLFMGSERGDILQAFYRLTWEHSLRSRQVTTFDLQILHQDSLVQLSENLKSLEQLYELANFGRTYSLYIKESLTKEDLPRARHESAKLQEVEMLVHTLGRSVDALAPLCAFHQKRQALIPMVETNVLADQMSQQFKDMQSRVLVLLDLNQSLFHTTLQNESVLTSPPITNGRADG